jgi:hypothetical protein
MPGPNFSAWRGAIGGRALVLVVRLGRDTGTRALSAAPGQGRDIGPHFLSSSRLSNMSATSTDGAQMTRHFRISAALFAAVMLMAGPRLALSQGNTPRFFLGCWVNVGSNFTTYTKYSPGGFYVSRLVRQVGTARYVLTIQGRWWVTGNVFHLRETSIFPRSDQAGRPIHRYPQHHRARFQIVNRNSVRVGRAVSRRTRC